MRPITRSTIAKIESGVRKTVTADEIAVLARVLGVTPTELLAPPSDSTTQTDPSDLPSRPMRFGAGETLSLLARVPLFAGVDQGLLQDLAAQAVARRYHRGQVLFYEGEPGGSLMVLTDGRVKLATRSETGAELVVDIVEPPGSFGEITFVDGGRHTTSAEALVPTTVLALSRDVLRAALRTDAALAEALLMRLAQRVRATHELATDLAFRDLPSRVAKLLVTTAPTTHAGGLMNLEELRLSQRDLSGMVGGSRQGVNKILHDFQARGWVRVQDRTVTLLRPDLLRLRAGL
jgi:CRP-like cAMP-binding protein